MLFIAENSSFEKAEDSLPLAITQRLNGEIYFKKIKLNEGNSKKSSNVM